MIFLLLLQLLLLLLLKLVSDEITIGCSANFQAFRKKKIQQWQVASKIPYFQLI